MCGFFITNEPSITGEHECIIEENLRFRGPDCSSGIIQHKSWKAYHSRLSIIDLNAGTNQPMIDDKGGLLVFNGEVLNFKELGLKYFNKEYTSDTKLLSDLLKDNLLNENELDGFFAFVYINYKGQLKKAVRDHFGVKPLYYYETDKGITFSSEPNVIKELFNTAVNDDAIEEYKVVRAPIFSGSFFDGVKLLSPGTCSISGQYFEVTDYIESSYEQVQVSVIKDAVEKGVKTRLVSDAPVGLLLSKGIDSNLIRHLGDFEKYYTIGFSGDADLEWLRSQNIEGLVALECSPEEYKEAFDYLINLRKEPMSVPNEVLLYLVSKKAASDGIKVLLSGEGADEFFGGYDRIFTWANKADKFDVDKFINLYCYSKPQVESVVYKKFIELFNTVKFGSPFEYVRWFFIKYHMPILFRRLDFSLMAAGVEGREPIANLHTFLEAIKIKPEDLMYKGLGKKHLRECLAIYMGQNFAYEDKVGFPVDLTKVFSDDKELNSYQLWFKNNLKVLGK